MKKWILFLLLGIVLYIVLGAVLPFVFQPKVTEETAAAVAGIDFWGEEPGTERAGILADNGHSIEYPYPPAPPS